MLASELSKLPGLITVQNELPGSNLTGKGQHRLKEVAKETNNSNKRQRKTIQFSFFLIGAVTTHLPFISEKQMPLFSDEKSGTN
jgi:hypothetical protein